MGRNSYRLALLKILGRDRGAMPWTGKREISRFVGLSKLADFYDEIEREDRVVYATFLIGALTDLGGRCYIPKSNDGLKGLLAEAERRYAMHRKERQAKVKDSQAA